MFSNDGRKNGEWNDGIEWNEFWICYAYITKSLMNQRQLERSGIDVMSDEEDS
jgi:hypothetical protein